MAKTADQLLNELDGHKLVPAEVLASLRRQVAKAPQPVPPATIARLLVEKGHLTAAQSQRLLATGPLPSQPARPAADVAPLEDLESLDDLQPLAAPGAASDLLSPPDLAPLDLSADLGGPLTAAQAAAPVAAKRAGPPVERSGVLSAVLLGLAALALSVTAAALFLLPRASGDEAYELAEQDYGAKQYEAAVVKYDALLSDFPGTPHAGRARTHRGVAQVLAARAASPRDWRPVLAVAKEALPPIAGEPGLAEAHGELAPLLAEMAADLADRAETGPASEAQDRLAAAREALALASDGRFVPGSLRPWQRLAIAEESLARLAFVAERDQAQAAASGAIQKAIDSKDLAAALAQGDATLSNEAAQAMTDLAATQVQKIEPTGKVQTGDARPAILGSIAFHEPAIRAASAAAGSSPAVVVAGGSAWAFESATGRLLWRRPLGGAAVAPVPAEGAVLLADDARSEVLCVDAAAGAVRWRVALEGAPLQPLVVGARAVVTTRAGQVVLLDAKSGATQAAVQLPQPARTSAVADASGRRFYQLADQSLLYALSGELACERAVFVGHAAGGAVAPPLVLGRQLLVVENRGASGAALHVVLLDAAGLPERKVQTLDVGGRVAGPPLALAGQAVVLTDDGRVLAFESAADPADGLKQIAAGNAGDAAGLARYGLVHADRLLVAGSGLSQWGPPAGGNLKQHWTALAGDVLLGPPHVVGNLAIGARQTTGGPIVAAVALADGKPAWETRLAEPVVAIFPLAGDGQAAAAFASGAVAKLNVAELTGMLVRELPPSQPPRQIGGAVLLESGRHLLVSAAGAKALLLVEADGQVREIPLPGELAGRPVAWQGGLAVACTSGALVLIDPQSGTLAADPLQLRLRPGERLQNCRLAAVGDELIVADGRLAVYRVGLATDPAPHLVELAAARLTSPPIAELVVGDKLLGVADNRGQLLALALPDLTSAPPLDLAASAVLAGPVRLGQITVLATDRDELLALDASLRQLWKVPLQHGSLAGEPVADAAGIVVATHSGWLCRLQRESGQELTAVDLGQPLSGTPLVVGQVVLVPAADGCVLAVALPEKMVMP